MCNAAASLNSGGKKNSKGGGLTADSRQGLDWRSLPHYRVRKPGPGLVASSPIIWPWQLSTRSLAGRWKMKLQRHCHKFPFTAIVDCRECKRVCYVWYWHRGCRQAYWMADQGRLPNITHWPPALSWACRHHHQRYVKAERIYKTKQVVENSGTK